MYGQKTSGLCWSGLGDFVDILIPFFPTMTQIYYSCCEFNVTALCNGKICQTLGADVLSIINIKHLTLCLLLHKEASIKLLKATFQAYRR